MKQVSDTKRCTTNYLTVREIKTVVNGQKVGEKCKVQNRTYVGGVEHPSMGF